MKINIQKHMLLDVQVKNEILFASLNVINNVKIECFEAVFMMIRKALKYFERKNRTVSKKQHIEHILFLSLIIKYK